MRFFDHPRYVEREVYESAIEQVVESVTSDNDVVAVYQLGSIGTPGISDIDLLVVLHDKTSIHENPLRTLDKTQRYLFTHGIFSLSASDFDDLQRFTLYHNCHLRWGRDPVSPSSTDRSSWIEILQKQIALEYLLSNYIARTIELAYKAASLRKLMLSIHAIKYDLQFLDVTAGPFAELVEQMITWRKKWFERQQDQVVLAGWLKRFCRELEVFLDSQLQRCRLALVGDFPCRLSRHICLSRTKQLGVEHRGLPNLGYHVLSDSIERKLLNRLNRFTFGVPFQPATGSDFLLDRINFFQHLIVVHDSANSYSKPPISSLQYSILRASDPIN